MNTDTVKYVVKDNKIGYYEFDSISFSTYHGYLTAFTYFKENELGKISN